MENFSIGKPMTVHVWIHVLKDRLRNSEVWVRVRACLAGRKSDDHAYADLERRRPKAFLYFVMEEPDGSSVQESSETLPDSSWTVSCLRNYLKEHGGRLSGEKNASCLNSMTPCSFALSVSSVLIRCSEEVQKL